VPLYPAPEESGFYGQLDKDILFQLDQIQQQLAEHDNSILLIFEYIEQLEQAKQQLSEQQNRRRIGFGRSDEDS
jgi:hypothetical protein